MINKRMFFLTGLMLGALSVPGTVLADTFGLPIDCELGQDCHLQQLPDMDPGPGSADPFCRSATYDGHSGTDIRILTMSDLARNVPVVASADGTVVALRDGMDDRIVRTDGDRHAIENRECGNGVVIDHADGWRTQYCHLKRGSVQVQEGDVVTKGAQLGAVGASGMAQFPHVHLTISKDGIDLDPFTGRSLDAGCDGNLARAGALWDEPAGRALSGNPTQVLAAGLADEPVDHDRLVEQLPDRPTARSGAIVGWAYVINLEDNDRVGVRLYTPDDDVFSETLTEPNGRPQASYSAFAGRARSPQPGVWRVETWVERDGIQIGGKVVEHVVE